MPNIAQQDYNRIYIEDFSSPTAAEKAEIRKAIANGIILDTLLCAEETSFKIVGYAYNQILFIDDSPTIQQWDVSED